MQRGDPGHQTSSLARPTVLTDRASSFPPRDSLLNHLTFFAKPGKVPSPSSSLPWGEQARGHQGFIPGTAHRFRNWSCLEEWRSLRSHLWPAWRGAGGGGFFLPAGSTEGFSLAPQGQQAWLPAFLLAGWQGLSPHNSLPVLTSPFVPCLPLGKMLPCLFRAIDLGKTHFLSFKGIYYYPSLLMAPNTDFKSSNNKR